MDSSQQYTVLARRFRPQAFDDVVGQEHVARALRNAIRSDRVAHAYLFTGARGVGKTSTARIFAKALNCPDVSDGVPCNRCDVCEAVSAGQDVDVLEIDGASNRGIDDVRQLRANVGVKSMRSRCKIYIIDEVHMLTKEAFNALLKTLEEPPPNVKFVFCTTEPNKVPDTILSRCQRFDFATIETTRIADRLREIAEAEGRSVEPAAIDVVARRAAGSMRDSQSLFDQLLAFGGETITPDDVHGLLGTADDERLLEITTALFDRRADLVLTHLDKALEEGVQLSEFLDQLVSVFRDLMIVATGASEVALLSVSGERRLDLATLASRRGLPTIVAAMQILAAAKARTERVNHARALVELALVRVASLEELSDVATLVETVRSGQPIPIPSGMTSVAPPSSSGPEVSSPPEAVLQKEDVSDLAVDTTSGMAPADPESTEPPSVAQIPFESGREDQIIAELKSNVEDATSMQLGMLAGSAILGPNRMELSFPTSYDLAKRYCEQPVVQSRIVEVLSAIAGQPVNVTWSLVAADRQRPLSESREREATETPPREAGDLFAAKVQDLFGATILKVEEPSGTPTTSDGSTPSDEE